MYLSVLLLFPFPQKALHYQSHAFPCKLSKDFFNRLERYRDGWALNLLTLSALFELQGVSILQTQTWYLPFLQAFLGRDDHQGKVLLAEKERLQQLKERLQQLIEGASIGKQ